MRFENLTSIFHESQIQRAKTVFEAISSAPVDTEGLLQMKHFLPESFDRVLLDPPCSALGLRPRLACSTSSSLSELEKLVSYQKQFIHTAVGLLKPGGTLVYSTCTINPLENECRVSYILEHYPTLVLVKQEPHLGEVGLPGCGLDESQCKLVQRFDPISKLDTIGFFCAKFEKREQSV